ncbi:hypothetical protein E2C01_032994 [Portunus trituberculatus]|uniref:Uncharacterized protein n=1 Tax=Portunus trituberculatus TaxID=210409 RepID=A0A5B7F1U3_PORTR|nr:hypothetical protein [Portunus trituberculatus]
MAGGRATSQCLYTERLCDRVGRMATGSLESSWTDHIDGKKQWQRAIKRLARGEWECGRGVGDGRGLATLPQTHCGSQSCDLLSAEASHSLCVLEPVVTQRRRGVSGRREGVCEGVRRACGRGGRTRSPGRVVETYLTTCLTCLTLLHLLHLLLLLRADRVPPQAGAAGGGEGIRACWEACQVGEAWVAWARRGVWEHCPPVSLLPLLGAPYLVHLAPLAEGVRAGA